MAQWTTVFFFVFALTCVNSSRIYQNQNSKAKSEEEVGDVISAEMQKALNDWYSDKKKPYRYVILEVPEDESAEMSGYTAPQDKTYADFLQSIKSCAGACIGAFEFSWEVPRGGGFVDNTEAAMFTWAPDETPTKYAGPRNMRKWMSMKFDLTNFRIPAIRKVINRWNPKIIHAGDADDLKPEWVVPQLRGGRFGHKASDLKPDGKALLDQLNKEIAGGASDPIKPDENSEPTVVEDSPPPVIPPKDVAPPVQKPPVSKPTVATGPATPLTANDKAEMLEIINHLVSEAVEQKKAEIIKAAEKAAVQAVEGVASKAAKDAVVSVFKDMVKKI